MTNEEYRKQLELARAELESLAEQRDEIERRMSHLKQLIVALAPLTQAEDRSEFGIDLTRVNIDFTAIGITDACREILKSAGQPLSPVEVKARLIQMKPEFANQKNLMASVHTVLKRLVPSEARSFITKDGETVYRWRHVYRRRIGRRMGLPPPPPISTETLVGKGLTPPPGYQAVPGSQKKESEDKK